MSTQVPKLKAQHVILRPLDRQDEKAVVRVAGDYEVAKWTGPLPHPYSDADFVSYFERVQAGTEGFVWAIDHGDTWVGMVSVGPSLGYFLDPEHWGRGFMTEAVGQVVDFWFGKTDASDMRSSFFLGNKGSQSVLRKNGFKPTGTGMSYCQARGENVEKRLVRLTRERWRSLRQAAVCDTASNITALQG